MIKMRSADLMFTCIVGVALVAMSLHSTLFNVFIGSLVIWSIMWCVCYRKTLSLARYESVYIAIVILFFLLYKVSQLLQSAPPFPRPNDYSAYFLLAIPFYLHARRRNISLKALAVWAVIALFAGHIGALWQVAIEKVSRAGMIGHGFPILFSYFSLLLICVCVVCYFAFTSSQKMLVPCLLAALLGLLSILLSGSRGGFVTIPLIALALLWYEIKFNMPGYIIRPRIICSVVVFLFLTGAVVSSTDAVQSMYDRLLTLTQKILFLDKKQSPPKGWGQDIARKSMIDIGILLFREKPFFGQGWQTYQANKDALVNEQGIYKANPQLRAHMLRLNQPHNEYIRMASEYGIIGLVILCFFLLLPVYWFWRKCMSRTNPRQLQLYALNGLLISLAYVQFYFLEGIITRSSTLSNHLFFLALFAAQVHRLDSQRHEEP